MVRCTPPKLKLSSAAALLLALVATSNSSAQAPELAPRLVVQSQHFGQLSSLDVSPDGRLALTAGAVDQSVRIWSVQGGRLLATFHGRRKAGGLHGGAVIVGDNRRVLVADGRFIVRWDPETGASTDVWEAPSGIWGSGVGIAISGDRRTIVASAGFDLFVLDATTLEIRRIVRSAGNPNVRAPQLAVSGDGRYVAVPGGDAGPEYGRRINLWNVESGKLERSWLAHGKSISSLAFTRDGRALMSAHAGIPVSAPAEPAVRVWEVETGALLATPDIGAGPASEVADSPLGIVVTLATGVAVISPGDWRVVHRLPVAAAGLDRPMLARAAGKSTLIVGMFGGGITEWGGSRGSARAWTRDAYGAYPLALTRQALVARQGTSLPWGTVLVWALESGERGHLRKEQSPFAFQDGELLEASSVGVSDERNLLAVLSPPDSEVALYDLQENRKLRAISVPKDADLFQGGRIALSGDGRVVVLLKYDTASLYVFRTSDGGLIHRIPVSRALNIQTAKIAISRDGSLVALADTASPGRIQVIASSSGVALWSQVVAEKEFMAGPQSIDFSPDGSRLAVGTRARGLRIYDARSGRLEVEMAPESPFASMEVDTLAYAPDGAAIYSSSVFDGLWRWDLVERKRTRIPTEAAGGPVRFVSMAADGRFLVAGMLDGTIALWHRAKHAWVARLYQLGSDERNWLVVDAEGRFDAGRLEMLDAAHWVLPDRPHDALPLESFMREYYQPGLLTRITAEETLAPVRALGHLDRRLPRISIVGLEPQDSSGDRVRVTVELEKGAATGEVHDVKLFRDGQLVGQMPAEGGRLALDAGGKARVTFGDIRLPTARDSSSIMFSAYAFNADRVKSTTAILEHAPGTPPRRRRSRLITVHVGVDSHENSAWDLGYAAADARGYGAVLNARFRDQERYGSIESLYLISEHKPGASGNSAPATKANLRALLNRLAGRSVDPEAQVAMRGAREVEPATPDDAVIITFSGHGFTGQDGEFYLVPHDNGPGASQLESDGLRRRSISTAELAEWMRGIDAGELTLILDACQSAASVAREGFKPGPLGSRGLGQLAYEKGMRILAATQADDFAIEVGVLRHGLLTYVLAREGMERAAADFQPRDRVIELDEWLRYGVARVPHLYREIVNRRFVAPRGLTVVPAPGASPRARRAGQRPAFFDFRQSRSALRFDVPQP